MAARVADAVTIAQKRHQTKFIGYLGEHEAAYAAGVARSLDHTPVRMFGGYEGASRVFLGVFSQYDEPMDELFPIFPVTFILGAHMTTALSHRDYLGALLNLGLSRDSVGDIITQESGAVAFLNESAAALAVSELAKVGGAGVKVQKGIPTGFAPEKRFETFDGVVASERLDCVVALVTRLSREKAAQLIESGLVGLNGREQDNISYRMAGGDTFSIRGYGKFVYDGISGTTKKGRAHILLRRYT